MNAWQARFRPLLRTSAMRMALRYALLQVGVLALALLGLFWTTYDYVQQEIRSGLEQDMATLRDLPQPLLTARIQALAAHAPGGRRLRDYLLVTPEGVHMGSPVSAWPQALPLDGKVHMVHLGLDDSGVDRDDDAQIPAIASHLTDGSRLLIAQEAGRLEDMRDVLPWVAGGLLLLAAGLSLTLGFALGLRWLGRVESINRTAASVMEGSLTARIPLSANVDEFDELARRLNAMLERIEQAVTGMRDVSDHVAHDLRKPLSRLKTRLELALREDRALIEYREAMQQAIHDADEMMRSFEAMLAISRLEAGSEILAPEPVDLTALLGRLAGLYADEAEESGRPFGVDLSAGLVVQGSAPLLGQALANLLDNAFLHTLDGTAIDVRAYDNHAEVVVEIIDHGPGIPSHQQARMMERFSRGDSARTLPGSGLGLALVRAVVHAHHGVMSLAETPHGGLTIRLVFPSLRA